MRIFISPFELVFNRSTIAFQFLALSWANSSIS